MSDRYRDTGKTAFELFPRYYQEGDTYAVLEKFCEILDTEFKVWDGMLDELAASRRIDIAPDEQLNYLYAERGINPPSLLEDAQKRKVLMQMALAYRNKGDLTSLRDMLAIALDISVEIIAFWSSPRYWRIGVGVIGHAVVGIPYKERDTNAFVIGTATVSTNKILSDAQNQDLVYTFQVRLSRSPLQVEERVIDWIVNLLKKAEEHYVIWYPALGKWWTINESQISVDSMVAPPSWIIGHSITGKSTRVGPSPVTPPSAYGVLYSTGTWVPWRMGGLWYP